MKRTLGLLMLTASLTLVAGAAHAQGKGKKKDSPPAAAVEAARAELPTPAIVEYRHGVMSAVGDHMGAVKAILKGEVERPDDLAYHVAAMHGAALDMVGLFPEGTGPDAVKTRALPEIWEKADDFAAAVQAYEAATAKLLEIVTSDDASGAMDAFGEVGKSCGGCHKPFRAEAR